MTNDILPAPLPNSYWVEPGRLLAGEYPGSDDHENTIRRVEAFLNTGIDTFIDLTRSNELVPYEPILYALARDHGIAVRYHRLPITDFDLPSTKTMTAILDTVDDALHASRKVYVHCAGGVGRTGTTIGCYLVRHGSTGRQALAQIAEWWQALPKHIYYSRSPETDEQVKFILNWEEGSKP